MKLGLPLRNTSKQLCFFDALNTFSWVHIMSHPARDLFAKCRNSSLSSSVMPRFLVNFSSCAAWERDKNRLKNNIFQWFRSCNPFCFAECTAWKSSHDPMRPIKPMKLLYQFTRQEQTALAHRLQVGYCSSVLAWFFSGNSVSPRNQFLLPRWQLLRRPHGPIELLDADLAATVFILGDKYGQSRHAAAWHVLKKCLQYLYHFYATCV